MSHFSCVDLAVGHFVTSLRSLCVTDLFYLTLWGPVSNLCFVAVVNANICLFV